MGIFLPFFGSNRLTSLYLVNIKPTSKTAFPPPKFSGPARRHSTEFCYLNSMFRFQIVQRFKKLKKYCDCEKRYRTWPRSRPWQRIVSLCVVKKHVIIDRLQYYLEVNEFYPAATYWS